MFDHCFDPNAYIYEYYNDLDLNWDFKSSSPLQNVGQENSFLLATYARIVLPIIRRLLTPPIHMLEVGGGPTIYQLISLSKVVNSILFTDFLSQNVNTVCTWREGQDAFWHPYIRQALKWEQACPILDQVLARERLIKSKLRFGQYDVMNDQWLNKDRDISSHPFQVVCSNFCIESATNDVAVWLDGIRHLSRKVASPGILVMTALGGSEGYQVGLDRFPALNIKASILRQALELQGFDKVTIFTQPICNHSDYSAFLVTVAERWRDHELCACDSASEVGRLHSLSLG
jgi:hypothetical protein